MYIHIQDEVLEFKNDTKNTERIITTINKQLDNIKNLNSIVNDYKIWNEYVQCVSQLSDIIPELESAIIGKDNILIGDMLLYEVISIFELVLDKLQLLIPRVVDKDVS